ncbi:hypothetical protein AB1K18_09350 [Peribacillus simplex]
MSFLFYFGCGRFKEEATAEISYWVTKSQSYLWTILEHRQGGH